MCLEEECLLSEAILFWKFFFTFSECIRKSKDSLNGGYGAYL